MQMSEHFTLRELTRSQIATRLGIDNTPDAEAIENLKRVAETYLRAREGSVAVLSSADALGDCRSDLTVFQL